MNKKMCVRNKKGFSDRVDGSREKNKANPDIYFFRHSVGRSG